VVQEDLDFLLYGWLSEPDEHRAEQQFTRYFRAAFPAICRYLRSLHTDPATAQDIAQQALIKLFTHLGTGRREADERLREALSALRPLELGALHVRQVEAWGRQVAGCRDAAVNFRVSGDSRASREPWKERREEINGRIPPLTRQAVHFIGEVRSHIEPRLSTLVARDSSLDGSSGQAQEDDALASDTDQEMERFLTRLFELARSHSVAEADTALGCAGAVGFLSGASTVRWDLPRVAVPSNGLLYTMSKRALLDRLRAGRYQTVQSVEHLADGTDDGVLSVLDTAGEGGPLPTSEESTWVSPEDGEQLETEVEPRYRAFLEFLRAPLTRAEGALAAAAAKGQAKVERARVDSLRAKYDRLLSVLAALREDPPPTEEQIARREGLSRNQIKYVIERIREEFTHFFPDLARRTDGRRRQGGDSSAGEALGSR
jgi:hypothetical protein